MGEVVYAPFITKIDVPAERVMTTALGVGLERVVIIGYDQEGEEYFASSIADAGDVLWLMERAKLKLLTVEVP